MADELLTKDLLLYDPLSPVTRKERTYLLGLSMLGIAMVQIPLVPEKLTALGIEFSKLNQIAFVRSYALIISYYTLAFAAYALADYVAWKRQEAINEVEFEIQRANRKFDPQASKGSKAPELNPDERVPTRLPLNFKPAFLRTSSYWLAKDAIRIRASLDFIFPIGFAAYSVFALLRYSP